MKRSSTPPPTPMAKRKYVAGKRKAVRTSKLYRMPKRVLPLGCPTTTTVRLVYNQSISITPPNLGTLSSDQITFRCNGVFDPLFDIGGGQPLYYDQWAAMYNKYVVTGAKIMITHTASVNPTWICVRAVTTPTPVTGLKGFQESSYNSCKLAAVGGPPAVAILQWRPSQFFIGKTTFDEELASETSTSPDRQVYFSTMMYSADNASLVSPRISQVKIEYDVIFFDKIQPSAS